MRYLGLAMAALLGLPPTIAPAATSWQTATATSVTGGVSSKSTFVIDAYLTMPQSCYAARIRTYTVSTGLHRTFIVEQRGGPMCSGSAYKCTVTQNFMLPIQQPFDVYTKGKVWHVHLTMHPPTPIPPMCH